MAETERKSLEDLRAEIDGIDREVVRLLNRRAACAQAIGRVKAVCGSDVYCPGREAAVIRRAAGNSSGPLSGEAVQSIYREVIGACRALERKLRVAFLGPVGTYSEMALLQRFGGSVDGVACPTIDEIFRQAEAGSVDLAIVPMENSTEGAVSRTLDLLLTTRLRIVAETAIPIHHNLLTKSGTLEGVKVVAAHSQALAQCTQWLASHVPNLELVAARSNGEAAQRAGEDPTIAAIASARAAELWNLRVVEPQIEDTATNQTRFVVLGRRENAPSPAPIQDKTSLVISTPNVAGAMYHALEPLDRYGVSMTRFESRPARNGAWAYYFYVDVEGHAANPVVAAALAELQAKCRFFKNLGSYPMEVKNEGL